MPTKTPETHVIRLGNPVAHEPIAEHGKVIGHRSRKDLGQLVLGVQLPDADAAPLYENVAAISDSIKERGRDGYILHILTQERGEDWEIASRHMLVVANAHARAGIDWVHTGHEPLDEALGILLNASVGEREGYGRPTHGLESRELRDMIERAGVAPEELLEHIQHEAKRWPALLRQLRAEGVIENLKTQNGVDLVAGNVFGESATVAQLNFLALTPNAAEPKNTNTTLAEEIKKAGGGLIRKKATYAHTNATATATLTATFTANAEDALPVTANKFGGFNASSSGTMGLETAITATTFNASGDNVTLTDTLTIS